VEPVLRNKESLCWEGFVKKLGFEMGVKNEAVMDEDVELQMCLYMVWCVVFISQVSFQVFCH